MGGAAHAWLPIYGCINTSVPQGLAYMGKMATKGGHEHDDNNGPAATTCWQNLGVAASQARLQLVWWWCMVTTSCWRPQRVRWLSSRHGCLT